MSQNLFAKVSSKLEKGCFTCYSEGKSHNNRAFSEESMKIGIPIDFDMLKTMRSGPHL